MVEHNARRPCSETRIGLVAGSLKTLLVHRSRSANNSFDLPPIILGMLSRELCLQKHARTIINFTYSQASLLHFTANFAQWIARTEFALMGPESNRQCRAAVSYVKPEGLHNKVGVRVLASLKERR